MNRRGVYGSKHRLVRGMLSIILMGTWVVYGCNGDNGDPSSDAGVTSDVQSDGDSDTHSTDAGCDSNPGNPITECQDTSLGPGADGSSDTLEEDCLFDTDCPQGESCSDTGTCM